MRVRRLKNLIATAFPVPTRLFKIWHLLAVGYGQKRSIELGRAVDRAGRPLPWYTYGAIEYLRQFDFSQAMVFEFGAGNSSFFWAERAMKVVSVESEPGWFERVSSGSPKNLEIRLRTDRDSYIGFLLEHKEDFDIIAIDGRWRNACIATAPAKLRKGGIIILDNSDRYPAATEGLRQAGFFQIDFNGLGPVNQYAWTTSFFIRADSHLQHAFAGPSPLGGLRELAGSDE